MSVQKSYDEKPSDYLDNRQTPAAATVLLPSPTLPRDLNHQIIQNTYVQTQRTNMQKQLLLLTTK